MLSTLIKAKFKMARPDILSALDDVMPVLKSKYDINTRQRLAYFLTQVAHESDYFKTFEEYASGAKYEGRVDLGNIHKGDGRKYKGRGGIQITGRFNYDKMSKLIGVDLINNPEKALDPHLGWEVSAAWWKNHGLNPLADANKFFQITKIINGSTITNQTRLKYLPMVEDAVLNSKIM